MKESVLYPLKFQPQFKEKIWGGAKLKQLFGKDATIKTGESWELSGVPDNISKVANGPFAGKDLLFLMNQFGSALLGERVMQKYNQNFPLLFKFIDAKEDLSVQLHPNDEIAQQRHNSFGKTEMWYILQADPGARLILGFKEGTERADYLKALEKNELTTLLQEVPVQTGDAFFIPTGTVHAIGGGVVLAEIQQTSDITYRIYDWNRPDTDGKLRTLHTQEALDSISFSSAEASFLKPQTNGTGGMLLCNSDYFSTSVYSITSPIIRDYSQLDSFVVYMCVEGSLSVKVHGFHEILSKGETLLIPASFTNVVLKSKQATFLEVFVP